MCGIIGYSGEEDARYLLVDGLKKLEYRGYDSWGVAGLVDNGIFVFKRVGKIGDFENVRSFPPFNIGIAHTRWATHGGVSEKNAHPHLSCDGRIAVVHNGIIENFVELRKELEKKGHKFISETDTEVIPHLIEEEMKTKPFIGAVYSALTKIRGAFALAIIDSRTKTLVAVRNFSPLVLGMSQNGIFVSSDPVAFVEHTNKVIYLEDGDVAVIQPGVKCTITDLHGKPVSREIKEIHIKPEHISKGGYPHYMLKEITEQTEALSRIQNYPSYLLEKAVEIFGSAYGIFFVGAGSSYNAALVASYVFSKVAKRHINVVYASEFPYYQDYLTNRTLVVAISQSGETADVIDAVKKAKRKGAKVMAVVNNENSTLARISDWVLPIFAGPEIGVAATKSFTSQLALLSMIAYAFSGKLQEGRENLGIAISEINELVRDENRTRILELAKKLVEKEHMFVIGRGVSYAVSLEGALKIKEISYTHAEGFPGGELKHGHIALIEEGTPVVVIAPDDETWDDIISNAMEVKARGAYVIGIAHKEHEVFDCWIRIPRAEEFFALVGVVPMQLLSYYLAVFRGHDPDKPRNLAKSVTVK